MFFLDSRQSWENTVSYCLSNFFYDDLPTIFVRTLNSNKNMAKRAFLCHLLVEYNLFMLGLCSCL